MQLDPVTDGLVTDRDLNVLQFNMRSAIFFTLDKEHRSRFMNALRIIIQGKSLWENLLQTGQVIDEHGGYGNARYDFTDAHTGVKRCIARGQQDDDLQDL